MPEFNCRIRTWLVSALTSLSGWAAVATAEGRTIDNPFLDLSLEALSNVPVTIATGTAKSLNQAPAIASVITASDIKTMGWRSLHEALESVPGMHVSVSPTNRLNNLISIRGLHTNENAQVVVMIDGLPLNNLVHGNPGPRFTIPVENISRIEVIRGPGSAVYGADAYAGVINVVTKDPDELKGLAAGIRAGSFDTQDLWVQSGGRLGGWQVAFNLEYSHSGGDPGRVIDSDLQTILDDKFGTRASLSPGMLETRYQLVNTALTARRDHWTLRLNSSNLRDAGMGAGGAQAIDTVGNQETDLYRVLLDYDDKDPAPHWELASRLSYSVRDERATYRLLPPGATVPVGEDGNLFMPNSLCAPAPVCLVNFPDGVWGKPGGTSSEYRVELATTYTGFSNQRIRLAVGAVHQKLDTNETKNFGPGVIDGTVTPIDGSLTDVTGTGFVFFPNVSRTVRYVSVQDEWRITPAWELTTGARYDSYSDFGGTTNPRVALVWNAASNVTGKLLYGSAFRAPTLGELYFQNNPAMLGNKDLKPETLDTVEVALEHRPSPRWKTSFGLFHYQAKDLIEYVDHKAQNTGEQTGKGLEAEVVWQPDTEWQLKGNVALQYAEDEKTAEAVPNSPRRQAYLAAIWQPTPSSSVSAQTKWIGDRPRDRAAGDNRSAIADYTLVNLTARYRPAPRWELALLIHNLLDEEAREPSIINNGINAIPDDYPLEGRAVYLEARFRS